MNEFVEAPLAYIGDHRRLLQSVFELIEMAQHSIVLQMYLFMANGHTTTLHSLPDAFPEAETVAGWLIQKKIKNPSVTIAVILDTQTPDAAQLKNLKNQTVREKLTQAGILVLNANLFGTRFDSKKNRPRAARFHAEWQKQTDPGDWVQRQNLWQILHNVEDHRKNLIIDGGAWALLTSHNLMDVACFWHENAFVCGDAAARQLWQGARQALQSALQIPQTLTEGQRQDIARLSDFSAKTSVPYKSLALADALQSYPAPKGVVDFEFSTSRQRVLETLQIRPRLLDLIATLQAGESILAATAYFSDLKIWQALLAAHKRGVKIKILVDDMRGLLLGFFLKILVLCFINRAFLEWARACPGIDVRVNCSQDYRMMHLKTIAFLRAEPVLIGGQANYTPRSFDGSWLESNLEVCDLRIVQRFANHFDELWHSPNAKPLARRNLFNWILGRMALGTLKILFWMGLEL